MAPPRIGATRLMGRPRRDLTTGVLGNPSYRAGVCRQIEGALSSNANPLRGQASPIGGRSGTPRAGCRLTGRVLIVGFGRSSPESEDGGGPSPGWWWMKASPRDPLAALQAVSAAGASASSRSVSGCSVRASRGLLEDLEPEVAAALGPFVVLLGQHGSDQPDHRGSVGEDADDVGTSADLAVEPLVGVVGPELPPHR